MNLYQIMITREQKPCNTLSSGMIDKLLNINQWRKAFLSKIFILFLSIRGRINFLQFASYGEYKERRYRQQIEKRFDFLSFNKEFTLSRGCIAFDPGYVSKSGKKTPGVGWYWSGISNVILSVPFLSVIAAGGISILRKIEYFCYWCGGTPKETG